MGFSGTIWHNRPFKNIPNLETSENEFDLLLDSGAGMEGKMEGIRILRQEERVCIQVGFMLWPRFDEERQTRREKIFRKKQDRQTGFGAAEQFRLMDLIPPTLRLPNSHPNDSSSTSRPPRRDSRPAELLLRPPAELHRFTSILGFHLTSIWAATSAWLHWSAQLSSFYEAARSYSHAAVALMVTFPGRVFHFLKAPAFTTDGERRCRGGDAINVD